MCVKLLNLLAVPSIQGIYTPLIWVPCLLGFYSALYVALTFAATTVVAAGLGLTFGTILLLVDRFFVISMPPVTPRLADNSQHHVRDVLRHVQITVRVVARLTVSVLLAGIVSYVAAIAVFHERLTQELETRNRAATEDLTSGYSRRLADLETQRVQVLDQVGAARARRAELEELTARELAGHVAAGTSGVYGQGPAFRQWQAVAAKAGRDLDDVQLQASAEILRLDRTTEEVTAARDEAISRLQQTLASDFVARAEALARLRNESAEVARLMFFGFLFFAVLDVLPVLLKLLYNSGPYLAALAVREFQKVERARIEIEALRLTRAHRLQYRVRQVVSRLADEAEPPYGAREDRDTHGKARSTQDEDFQRRAG